MAESAKKGKNPDFINVIRGALVLAVVLIIVFIVLFNMFFVYIEPYEYGVRVVKVPLLHKRGVSSQEFTAGLHFVLPFNLERMYTFPRNVQLLELTEYPTGNRLATYEQAANIQTSDGFFVTVDVSILYHISDPYKVFTTLGPGNNYISQGLLPKAEPILKESFGELNTEEFYNSYKRWQQSELALAMLNQDLKPKGLQVNNVLVRYFKYSSEIQKNIEEKKLKDQLVFKNQAEAKAAIEEAKLKKVIEEGEAQLKIKMEEGNAYVVTRNAERDAYVRKRHAEADLLIKLADAEKTRLKNEALQGRGASSLVGLQLAELLSNLQMIVLPSDGEGGINPLDIDSVLRMLEVRGGAK